MKMKSSRARRQARLEAVFSRLDKLATKKRGEDIRWDGDGRNLDWSVVMVGKSKTLRRGLGPYIRYINRVLKDDVRRVYLLARGDLCIQAADKLATNFVDNNSLVRTARHETRFETPDAVLRATLTCLDVSRGSDTDSYHTG
jgi:hypothetical protein